MKIELLDYGERIVKKTATDPSQIPRIKHEVDVYKHLSNNQNVPRLRDCQKEFIEIEYIDGESMKDWIELDGNWKSKPIKMVAAIERLKMYIDAEMSLLRSGVMYRDMNLEHLLFMDKKAVLIDLEASSINTQDSHIWKAQSPRGTWETMAPEEFENGADLTDRTATYRAAVLTHIALAGRLPFRRVPESRSKAHKLRKKVPAQVSSELPYKVRRILSAALQVEPVRRPATPLNLFDKLELAYKISSTKSQINKGRMQRISDIRSIK